MARVHTSDAADALAYAWSAWRARGGAGESPPDGAYPVEARSPDGPVRAVLFPPDHDGGERLFVHGGRAGRSARSALLRQQLQAEVAAGRMSIARARRHLQEAGLL